MADIISYLRVSTARQGASGLGIEAQREAISRFTIANSMRLVAEYSDVQTGKGSDALDQRPGLANAMAHAKKIGATVVAAKLDRLSRSVTFISTLLDKGTSFMCADLGPNVRDFMLHIYAAVAQEERRMISDRTKSALAAAKARGVKLGNPSAAVAAAKGRQASRDGADAFAAAIMQHIEELQRQGVKSLADLAAGLNKLKGVEPARGEAWSTYSVHRIIKRSKRLA